MQKIRIDAVFSILHIAAAGKHCVYLVMGNEAGARRRHRLIGGEDQRLPLQIGKTVQRRPKVVCRKAKAQEMRVFCKISGKFAEAVEDDLTLLRLR
ncbi:hypothetical protein LJC63_09435, partial [Ruminococcaceae bacterium OttesenSCG-928-L11]|nr:hypothetical protein [Ruminococcaceae bacterium OttesenSCG-928-L11]